MFDCVLDLVHKNIFPCQIEPSKGSRSSLHRNFAKDQDASRFGDLISRKMGSRCNAGSVHLVHMNANK